MYTIMVTLVWVVLKQLGIGLLYYLCLSNHQLYSSPQPTCNPLYTHPDMHTNLINAHHSHWNPPPIQSQYWKQDYLLAVEVVVDKSSRNTLRQQRLRKIWCCRTEHLSDTAMVGIPIVIVIVAGIWEKRPIICHVQNPFTHFCSSLPLERLPGFIVH